MHATAVMRVECDNVLVYYIRNKVFSTTFSFSILAIWKWSAAMIYLFLVWFITPSLPFLFLSQIWMNDLDCYNTTIIFTVLPWLPLIPLAHSSSSASLPSLLLLIALSLPILLSSLLLLFLSPLHTSLIPYEAHFIFLSPLSHTLYSSSSSPSLFSFFSCLTQFFFLLLPPVHGLSPVHLQQQQQPRLSSAARGESPVIPSSHKPLRQTHSEPLPYSHSSLASRVGQYPTTQHHLLQQYHNNLERLKLSTHMDKVRKARGGYTKQQALYVCNALLILSSVLICQVLFI